MVIHRMLWNMEHDLIPGSIATSWGRGSERPCAETLVTALPRQTGIGPLLGKSQFLGTKCAGPKTLVSAHPRNRFGTPLPKQRIGVWIWGTSSSVGRDPPTILTVGVGPICYDFSCFWDFSGLIWTRHPRLAGTHRRFRRSVWGLFVFFCVLVEPIDRSHSKHHHVHVSESVRPALIACIGCRTNWTVAFQTPTYVSTSENPMSCFGCMGSWMQAKSLESHISPQKKIITRIFTAIIGP